MNDLLNEENTNLEVITTSDSYGKPATFINNLTKQKVEDETTILELLSFGENIRKTASTHFNISSSRSHTIFQINLELYEMQSNGQSLVKTSEINLVDLAGSESLSSGNTDRQRECKNINKSLLALSNVILDLSRQKSNSKFISYRTSKLTRILQKSLSGNSKTLIICTINQAK